MMFQSQDQVKLPDGSYRGVMGGYVVEVTKGAHKGYEFQTTTGVRCMACPCTIAVKDGVALVTLI